MILVTVGMHSGGFLRLVETMDRLAAQIDEQVLIQIGSTPYQPTAACWFDFVNQETMDACCRQARIVVSHAGAGSILTTLRCGKPLIVVPRRQQFGEHLDDHQLELADALAEAGVLIKVDTPEEVPSYLELAQALPQRKPDSGRLVQALRQMLAEGGQEGREQCVCA